MADRGRGIQGGRMAWGIFLLGLSVLLSLSLLSYDWGDISLLRVPPNSPPGNVIGPVGAWVSFGLLMAFGVSAFLIPLWCLIFGLVLILDHEDRIWPRGVWILVAALSLMALIELFGRGLASVCYRLNIPNAGGLWGLLITDAVLVRWLSPVGAGILLGVLFVTAIVIVVEMRTLAVWFRTLSGVVRRVSDRMQDRAKDRRDDRREERRQVERSDGERRRREEADQERLEEESLQREKDEKRRRRLERVMEPDRKAVEAPEKPRRADPAAPAPAPEPERQAPAPEPAAAVEPPARRAPPPPRPEPPPDNDHVTGSGPADASAFQLPPIRLLDDVKASPAEIQTDSATTSRILIETLTEFGIEADVTNVERGPTVTRYELLPAPGVRVEKISALSNNLALALKASSVRVQAPIPGKGVVGIEVPNASATVVYLRQVLEGDTWKHSGAKLPLVLGKDVGGNDLVADLAAMPHMLVAGATGAGKTVCINSIIAGLLMSRTPDQLRLMLVDPKIVEFAMYNDLPHLVVPVITNPKKVALALRWAINEMEKRYKLFAKVGVRNIESYNTREIIKQADLFEGAGDGNGAEPRDDEPPPRVPYIVIIIDELADLMLVDQAEIENSVARLAQLSRAVGIHMILSTQRPSVNVITGTIKANFPARIAYQVAQKTDSRTILDTIGAEKLLGRGDMLFLPPGTSKLLRAQGVLTTDEEIRHIVEHLKSQGDPDFELDIKEKIEKTVSKLEEGEDDEMISQAVEIIRETQRASTSSLQRRLRIGYTRAARVMDILEERGIIGPPRGSDAREILVDLDGDIGRNPAPADAPEPEPEPETDTPEG